MMNKALFGVSIVVIAGLSGVAGAHIEELLPTPAPSVQVHDTDGDGWPDDIDDCPTVSDPTQPDLNDNGLADACDERPGPQGQPPPPPSLQ